MEHTSLSEHFTVRVPSRLLGDLTVEAKRRGLAPTALARLYLEEGLRVERFPGIVFRSGPGGRRAGLAGRRLDVWQVLETVRASAGNVDDAAGYLRLCPDQVRTAIAYAADFAEEVEEWIRTNREEAERAREAEERQRAILHQ